MLGENPKHFHHFLWNTRELDKFLSILWYFHSTFLVHLYPILILNSADVLIILMIYYLFISYVQFKNIALWLHQKSLSSFKLPFIPTLHRCYLISTL